MIHFIPKKEYRELPPSHGLSVISDDDFTNREGTRGHVINIAREYICVFNFEDGFFDDNNTALIIAAAAAGSGISMPEGEEGFAAMRASQDGLLRIDEEALRRIDTIESVRFDTLQNNQSVLKGQVVAGVKILSRTACDDRLPRIEKLCHECRPLIDVLPFKQFRVGIVAIDTDIQTDRMNATINPILQEKFTALGSPVLRQECVSGDITAGAAAIRRLIDSGADLVVCAGGMNRGPDDQLAAAVRAAGGKITSDDHSPALSGMMVFRGWIGPVPVLRFPDCVMHHRSSVFDLVMPRYLAGVAITEEDFVNYGRDGLCLSSS
ncbi:MAG: molybdopterin-binding protein [Desulfoprunum sp.]|nr:molybdopterin-binding protein [Desulfoprunum sp.]